MPHTDSDQRLHVVKKKKKAKTISLIFAVLWPTNEERLKKTGLTHSLSASQVPPEWEEDRLCSQVTCHPTGNKTHITRTSSHLAPRSSSRLHSHTHSKAVSPTAAFPADTHTALHMQPRVSFPAADREHHLSGTDGPSPHCSILISHLLLVPCGAARRS